MLVYFLWQSLFPFVLHLPTYTRLVSFHLCHQARVAVSIRALAYPRAYSTSFLLRHCPKLLFSSLPSCMYGYRQLRLVSRRSASTLSTLYPVSVLVESVAVKTFQYNVPLALVPVPIVQFCPIYSFHDS